MNLLLVLPDTTHAKGVDLGDKIAEHLLNWYNVDSVTVKVEQYENDEY